MIETIGPAIAIIIPSLIIIAIGGIAFGLIAGHDREWELEQEIMAAQERLDAEERRFRIGEIDRRNLQQ
jgi:hypothetical protein